LLLTLLIHTNYIMFELSWSYSIWLESLAIYPQLHMIMKIKEVENITSNYMASLGLYRFFYILNWYWDWDFRIYKISMGITVCWTSILGGIVQTVLYADFLYYYIKSTGSAKMTIPVWKYSFLKYNLLNIDRFYLYNAFH
jgi:ER lumen protein retaining receptor